MVDLSFPFAVEQPTRGRTQLHNVEQRCTKAPCRRRVRACLHVRRSPLVGCPRLCLSFCVARTKSMSWHTDMEARTNCLMRPSSLDVDSDPTSTSRRLSGRCSHHGGPCPRSSVERCRRHATKVEVDLLEPWGQQHKLHGKARLEAREVVQISQGWAWPAAPHGQTPRPCVKHCRGSDYGGRTCSSQSQQSFSIMPLRLSSYRACSILPALHRAGLSRPSLHRRSYTRCCYLLSPVLPDFLPGPVSDGGMCRRLSSSGSSSCHAPAAC